MRYQANQDMEEPNRSTLTQHERIRILELLRESRALILSDAEAFQKAALTLEHIAQIAGAKVGLGLYKSRTQIVSLIDGEEAENRDAVERLFDLVRKARNMAVHDGAWVRNMNTRLVDLFLVLEAAIVSRMERIGDVMVRSPVVAEPWHRLAHARRAMLSNSFSALPICLDRGELKEWKILTDEAIVQVTRGLPETQRNSRLSLTIETAVADADLILKNASTDREEEKIDKLLSNPIEWPLLVLDERDRLIGILTPFDLL